MGLFKKIKTKQIKAGNSGEDIKREGLSYTLCGNVD
jgi:hypothetical protein